uniref:Uncharacterized protein n=1 Tax=Glossina brevipalpis TaxID=37001 RepID=A0A1A9WGS2_9MUSC
MWLWLSCTNGCAILPINDRTLRSLLSRKFLKCTDVLMLEINTYPCVLNKYLEMLQEINLSIKLMCIRGWLKQQPEKNNCIQDNLVVVIVNSTENVKVQYKTILLFKYKNY